VAEPHAFAEGSSPGPTGSVEKAIEGPVVAARARGDEAGKDYAQLSAAELVALLEAKREAKRLAQARWRAKRSRSRVVDPLEGFE
jgi:hypothetical protein